MDESNKIVKNKLGVICTPDYRQLLTKRSYFEIPKQSAEISWHLRWILCFNQNYTCGACFPLNFGPWVWIWPWYFEILKNTEFSESRGICLDCFPQFWKFCVFKNFKFLWSNSNSGTKIEWETCPTCLVLVKTQNSWPMSADFSWLFWDFKITPFC